MEDENQRPPAWVPMYISDWFVAASAMQADEFRDVVLKLCTYAITDERPVFKNRFAKLLLDRFEVEIPKSKARSAQAVAAARAKWGKYNKIKDGAMPEHMPEHMQMDMQPTPTPTPTITNTSEKVSCAFSDETAPAIARQVDHEKPAKQKKYTQAFDEFWTQYPRQIGKAAAFRSWQNALKGGTKAEIIMEGVLMFSAHTKKQKTENQFIPHPATWLNQGRWDDNLENEIRKENSNAKSTWPCFDENGNRIPEPGSSAAMWARLLHEANQEHMGKHEDDPIRKGRSGSGVVEGVCTVC